MWILLQLVGCALLATALAYMRQVGLTVNSWVFYVSVNVLYTSWAFSIAYKIAPSFLQVYFLGIALLTIFGFIGSIFYFKESVGIVNYIGAVLVFIGACLTVWR